MADPNFDLPPEYMAEIDAANKRRMIAQLLQKQALGYQGAPTGGRVAAKTSPLAWMANIGTGMLGSAADAQGAAQARDAQARAMADQSAETGRVLALPEDQQFSAAATSKFKQTQAIGKLLQEQRQARLKEFAGATKDVAPEVAAQALIDNRMPSKPNIPTPAAPTFGATPTGAGYAITTNRKGEKEIRFEPKGVNVSVGADKQENKFSLDALEAELKPRQEGALAAKNIYSATTRAVDALERGAKAGGGENIKQQLRKAVQAFGVTPSATAETEELGMALGNAILTEAAKIKPISNTDIETLKGIVGSIATDPTALTRALAYSQSLALRGLSDYSRFIDEQGKTLSTDVAKQRLAGSRIGYELPTQLSGPTPFQLEVLRNYQLGGGDISNFGEPGTGKPFTPGTKFEVSPTRGMPGINLPPAPTTLPPPANGKAYTPEEFQKLLQMLPKGQ